MAAMRQETELFVHSLIVEDEPIERLVDADYTYLNDELAKHYKIRGVRGEHMRRVKVDARRRGGIFAHGSLLAVTDHFTAVLYPVPVKFSVPDPQQILSEAEKAAGLKLSGFALVPE